MRPRSIVTYEKLFITQLVLGSGAVVWRISDRLSGSLHPVVANPRLILLYMIIVFIGIALNGVLWYFTARRPSKIARGLLAFALAMNVLSLIFRGVTRSLLATPVALIGHVNFVLFAVSVWLRSEEH